MVSKAVQARRDRYSGEVLALMQELGRRLGAEKFGPEGPPLETTFAEIEEIGHELGKMVATEFDQCMQRQHAEKFDNAEVCPQCNKPCGPGVKHRDLTTRDGPADLAEPEFHCVSCERSFFPSESSPGTRRK